MGGRLDGLTASAKLVLMTMAMNAHDTGNDTTPAGCYFRGWAHLASVLGHRGMTPAGARAVTRAMAELRHADLINVDDYEGHKRRQTAYRLTLW